MPKTVLVADDNAMVRKAVCQLINIDGRLAPCLEAHDGLEAVRIARLSNPDLIVLDLSMPNLNGLESAKAIREILPEVPIILFSIHSEQLNREDMRARSISVVPKYLATTDLLPAIQSLLGLSRLSESA